jgi:hypothetical protein
MNMLDLIPVILFAYARPDHLRRTLECLRTNEVPQIYAFSDGPRTPDKESAVREVRRIIKEVDWCKTELIEREENLGLGRSILTGVTEVFKDHEAAIIFEDDLICIPGTYRYLSSAMKHYQDESSVMSVTGWTHPRVIPKSVKAQPYFDGRAECWVWGTWARVWKDMQRDAKTLMNECSEKGIDVHLYGDDLPRMAEAEQKQNIWAVRFLYLHILHNGLCFRPPHSMVEHIGFDAFATNACSEGNWKNPPLQPCPEIPIKWPEPVENPDCKLLWQRAYGYHRTFRENLFKWI